MRLLDVISFAFKEKMRRWGGVFFKGGVVASSEMANHFQKE